MWIWVIGTGAALLAAVVVGLAMVLLVLRRRLTAGGLPRRTTARDLLVDQMEAQDEAVRLYAAQDAWGRRMAAIEQSDLQAAYRRQAAWELGVAAAKEQLEGK